MPSPFANAVVYASARTITNIKIPVAAYRHDQMSVVLPLQHRAIFNKHYQRVWSAVNAQAQDFADKMIS